MGHPKQLLDIDGKPLLQHVIDGAAESSLDEIVIVLGHEAQLIETATAAPSSRALVVKNDYSSGLEIPSSSRRRSSCLCCWGLQP
jgi:CTP:molybdopterin cytidylyltransferase MocA